MPGNNCQPQLGNQPIWRSTGQEDGGEEEIRTLDPHVANVMLYQLSYFPMR